MLIPCLFNILFYIVYWGRSITVDGLPAEGLFYCAFILHRGFVSTSSLKLKYLYVSCQNLNSQTFRYLLVSSRIRTPRLTCIYLFHPRIVHFSSAPLILFLLPHCVENPPQCKSAGYDLPDLPVFTCSLPESEPPRLTCYMPESDLTDIPVFTCSMPESDMTDLPVFTCFMPESELRDLPIICQNLNSQTYLISRVWEYVEI